MSTLVLRRLVGKRVDVGGVAPVHADRQIEAPGGVFFTFQDDAHRAAPLERLGRRVGAKCAERRAYRRSSLVGVGGGKGDGAGDPRGEPVHGFGAGPRFREGVQRYPGDTIVE